jgi:hypothetical protein
MEPFKARESFLPRAEDLPPGENLECLTECLENFHHMINKKRIAPDSQGWIATRALNVFRDGLKGHFGREHMLHYFRHDLPENLELFIPNGLSPSEIQQIQMRELKRIEREFDSCLTAYIATKELELHALPLPVLRG